MVDERGKKRDDTNQFSWYRWIRLNDPRVKDYYHKTLCMSCNMNTPNAGAEGILPQMKGLKCHRVCRIK